MALLEVNHLTVRVQHKHTCFMPVDDASFAINAGEITALAGESGCGKSLTALSISGLLPPAPAIAGGSINYHAASGEMVNLCTLNEKSMCRIRGKEIAMIFQEPRQSLNPLMRVGAQIAETLELHGADKSTARAAALDTLKTLKFPEPEKILNAWPHQLSGGMCQRVMIAIAAICRPRLLIADEPLTALDSVNQEHILGLLKHINREFGTAILFISHDLPLARDFCSRFLIMRSGRIIEEGSPEKIFTAPSCAYTSGLIGGNFFEKKRGSPSGSPSCPAVSIRSLSNSYTSRNFGLFGKKEIKHVLHNVNLDIAAAEIFGLSGESGCGKTTLARCIVGLIGYEGEILVEGRQRVPGQIQMIFQDPGASLNPAKKIGWLMEEPLIIHRRGTPEQRSRKVDEMLIRVGLDPLYKTRLVNELSGGQKQRVCIGRALMLDSKILIADEAISSLDISVGMQILALFRDLRESLGLTIIFISHNKNMLTFLCDRVAVMKQADGKSHTVLSLLNPY